MKRWKILFGFLVIGIELALLESRLVWAEEDARYKIIMSKNKHLCTQVLNVLNEDLTEYGPRYDPGKFAAPIFTAIAWTPIKGLEEGFDYAGDVAHVDINNDGTTDVVVRQETSGGRDITFMLLFILQADQKLPKKRKELQDNAIGSVDLLKLYEFRHLPQKTFKGGPGGLEGKKYYEGLTNSVYIHPFQVDNVRYLLLTTSPDSRFVENYALVAKYKQGKVREADPALMDDLCYLQLK